MIFYSADFEATVHPGITSAMVKNNPSAYPTEVWLAGLQNVDTGEQTLTYSIHEFLTDLFERDSATIMFHNLKNYDSRFILQTLIERWGFTHHRMSSEFPGWKVIVGTREDFTVWHSPGHVFNFYDSRKILGGSIRSLGEMTGAVSKGEETPLVVHGTSLEQTKKKDGSFWNWEQAEEYMRGDIGVLAKAMQMMGVPECFEQGIKTQATLAYRTVFEPYESLGYEQKRTSDFRASKYMKKSSEITGIKRLPFPTNQAPRHADEAGISHSKAQKDLIALANKGVRNSYRGGVAMPNIDYRNRWLCTCEEQHSDESFTECKNPMKFTTIDVNSLYPYIYSTKPLPRYFKKMHRYDRKENAAEKLSWMGEGFKVVIFERLKASCKQGYLPTIKPRTDDETTRNIYYENGASLNGSYSRDIDFPIALTSVDVAYLNEFYDVEIAQVKRVYEYERSPEFESSFASHAHKWGAIKEKASMEISQAKIDYAQGLISKEEAQSRIGKATADKSYAKLQLNSPYGKLGQLPRSYPTQAFYVDEEGIYREEEGLAEIGGNMSADAVTASFITAYGRDILGRTVNKIGMDRTLYYDTDSITLKGMWNTEDLQSVGVEVDDSKMGAWAIENTGDWCKFLAPKTYMKRIWHEARTDKVTGEIIPGYYQWHATMAGFSRSDSVKPEDFHDGMDVYDKRSIQAYGGTLIVEHKMKIQGSETAEFLSRDRRREIAQAIAMQFMNEEDEQALMEDARKARTSRRR